MAILQSSDFTSQVVIPKIVSIPKYIDDDVVTIYWHELANDLGIENEYLPDSANITEQVRQYLVLSVMIHVAFDSIGSTLKQIGDGVAFDEWQNRYDAWKIQLAEFKSQIIASQVYDPDNVPPDDEVGNPNIISWERG